MKLLQYFETGPTRIPIGTSYYLVWIAALLYTQNILASIKPSNMSTNTKRILATPLLVTDLVLPVIFMDLSGCKSIKIIHKLVKSINITKSMEFTWCYNSVYGLSPLSRSLLGGTHGSR